MPAQTFKTIQDWLNWQETLHPSEIDLGLERVQLVLERLLPQCFESYNGKFPFTVITIAGTNGKGSTVAMLEAILNEAGYRVGCYTSPHLLQYNERIKLNRVPVTDEIICDSFARIEQAREQISLTYFEFGTLAAIDVFYQHQCDIVILEVGLGGRLDAVNIIDADIAMVTTVDIDHQDWLGSDRDAIGLEKAGIYRHEKPAIFGDDNLPESIRNKVRQEGLAFFQYSQDYDFNCRDKQWDWLPADTNGQFSAHYNLPLPSLKGLIQLKNAANVLMCLELLKDSYPVSQAEIKRGLQNTFLAGRFQIVSSQPLIILDVAHNVQAAKMLRQSIEQVSVPGKFNVIIGMLKDKEVREVIAVLLPLVDSWRVIELNSPRAMAARDINHLLQELLQTKTQEQSGKNHAAAINIQCFDSFAEAYQDYKRYNDQSGNFENLLVFGSFFIVSDALNTLNNSDFHNRL